MLPCFLGIRPSRDLGLYVAACVFIRAPVLYTGARPSIRSGKKSFDVIHPTVIIEAVSVNLSERLSNFLITEYLIIRPAELSDGRVHLRLC
jgi:hypothetical protein